MIRAVLWDVGGTLADFSMGPRDYFEHRLRRAGIDPGRLDQTRVKSAWREVERDECTWRTPADEARGFARHAQALLAGSVYGPQHHAPLAASVGNYFDSYKPVEGITRVIDQLRHHGIKQGIVSNWPPSLEGFLAHHALDAHMHTVVCSAREGILKPDARLFRKAIAALNVLPEHCLMIGNDPILDVAAARAVGLQALLFDPRKQHESSDATEAAHLWGCIQKLMLQ